MSYEDTDQPTVKIASDEVPLDVRFAQVVRIIHRYDDLPENLETKAYYWPLAKNNPLFDAFTVEFKGSSAVLWIIQIMMSRSHGGSGAGYRNIRNIIAKLKDQLRHKPPPKRALKTAEGSVAAPSVEVRYLIVVPKGGKAGLEWKFPNGWCSLCTKHDHCGKTYCLELPLMVCSTVIANRLNEIILPYRWMMSMLLGPPEGLSNLPW